MGNEVLTPCPISAPIAPTTIRLSGSMRIRIPSGFSGTDERPWNVIFKPDSDERVSLLEDGRFYSPPYFGPSGWLALDLEAGPVDWTEVRELADASYRQVALKRMLRALEG